MAAVFAAKTALPEYDQRSNGGCGRHHFWPPHIAVLLVLDPPVLVDQLNAFRLMMPAPMPVLWRR